MESILANLSFEFAVDVIKLCDNIKNRPILKNQLIKSATSIGANIREANYAYSRAEFAAKLQIALKECNESQYWIELMAATDGMSKEQATLLLNSCGTIRYKLIRSLNTVKRNGT